MLLEMEWEAFSETITERKVNHASFWEVPWARLPLYLGLSSYRV